MDDLCRDRRRDDLVYLYFAGHSVETTVVVYILRCSITDETARSPLMPALGEIRALWLVDVQHRRKFVRPLVIALLLTINWQRR